MTSNIYSSLEFGNSITAVVTNEDSTLSGDDIRVDDAGLAAMATDGDPNHGGGPSTWHFP